MKHRGFFRAGACAFALVLGLLSGTTAFAEEPVIGASGEPPASSSEPEAPATSEPEVPPSSEPETPPSSEPEVLPSSEPETPPSSEPETPPDCFCDIRCTSTTLNADCLACITDVSDCKGRETSPPVCSCSIKCIEGAVNVDCPICKLKLTACTGKAAEPAPDPKFTVTIVSPSGWYTQSAKVEIRVKDVNGTGYETVTAKVERSGSWIDLTDDLTAKGRAYVEISENCTIYASVTDKNGKATEKSRYIECFDREAPTIKAKLDGKVLRVEATDALSGVDSILIDGYKYTDLTDGKADIRLKDYADEDSETVMVQAVDAAGNKSKAVQVKNPYYEDKDKKKDDQKKENEDKKPTASCPQTSAPTTTQPTTPPATSAPTVSAPPTTTKPVTAKPTTPTQSTTSQAESSADNGTVTPTDGTGTVIENSTKEPTQREFFTIETKAGNIFYIVVDKQKQSENVYLLSATTETELVALAKEDSGESVEHGIPDPQPEPAPECVCNSKCEKGEVNEKCAVCAADLNACTGKATPEPEPQPEQPDEKSQKQGGGASSLVLILLVVAVGCGVAYYLKIYKPKHDLDDADDLDDFTFEEASTGTTEDEEVIVLSGDGETGEDGGDSELS